jgi:hypothetical protein
VGPGATSAESLTRFAESLSAQPWLRIRLAREVAASRATSTLKLLAGEEGAPAPRGYWDEVKEARDWALGLSRAVGTDNPSAQASEDNSLIAQSSAWAGVDGQWELAERGSAFASTARRSASDILSAVSMRIEPITLAGSSGQVPVTIVNTGDVPLVVELTTATSKGLDVEGPRTRRVELSPKDNFIELPVTMPDALRGRITVTLGSADVVLDRETVAVRASYLDRLVIVGGVVLLLVGMLVFIIRRVRTVESSDSAE